MFNWLQHLADWFTYSVLGISAQSHLGEALNFFVYDAIKIFILLMIITVLMGTINSYSPIDKVRDFLTRRKWYGFDYFVASFFGTITPFCSCSSVPLFIGFVKGGIPLGITFAFLISSPLVDAVTVAIFLGMFGWKTTIIYVVSGIILSMVAGYILGRMNLEPLLTDWVKELLKQKQMQDEYQEEGLSLRQRIPAIVQEAWGIVKSVSLYIVLGVAIGGIMHGYIPTGFFEQYISKENPFAVPIAVLVGVPLYSNTAGILPIMQVLVEKGIALGTVIAFSMSVVALSIPEAMLLKKIMTTKMLIIFLTVVTICIIVSGYAFNLIL
jgi:uncharacterized membrane protein YraQ (UPF0718 family)